MADKATPNSVIGLPRHVSAYVLGYGLDAITEDSEVTKALRQLEKQGVLCVGFLIQLTRDELLSEKYQGFMTPEIVDKIESSLSESYGLRLNSRVHQFPDVRITMEAIEHNQQHQKDLALANMRRGREMARAKKSGGNIVSIDFGRGQ